MAVAQQSTLTNTIEESEGYMAHKRTRSAMSEFVSIEEAAERSGMGLNTARKLVTESGSWIVVSPRIKRVDYRKYTGFIRDRYGNN